jgi:hypothetical protein
VVLLGDGVNKAAADGACQGRAGSKSQPPVATSLAALASWGGRLGSLTPQLTLPASYLQLHPVIPVHVGDRSGSILALIGTSSVLVV